jgi:hypothetical protein
MASTGLAPFDHCPAVVEVDDSIGGEGDVECGSRILVAPDIAVCADGHRFVPCSCGRPVCSGWRLVQHRFIPCSCGRPCCNGWRLVQDHEPAPLRAAHPREASWP